MELDRESQRVRCKHPEGEHFDLDSSRALRVRLVAESRYRRRSLARALSALPWDIDFETGTDNDLERVGRDENDLILLDLGRPSDRALNRIHRICSDGMSTLVVVAQGFSDVDAARLLEAGARDVVREPLGSPLFLARCSTANSRRRAVENEGQLRREGCPTGDRREPHSPTLLAVGPICLDLARRSTMVGGRTVHLTRSEFLVLARLAQTPGIPVSTLELVTDVLCETFRGETSIARVHVHRVRLKLGPHGNLIQNVRPRAYRLVQASSGIEDEPRSPESGKGTRWRA